MLVQDLVAELRAMDRAAHIRNRALDLRLRALATMAWARDNDLTSAGDILDTIPWSFREGD
eukprot:6888141-Alexandrium_andersonii.AAC.1